MREQLNFEEFSNKFFVKDELINYRYFRRKDNYVYYADDVESSRNYYNKTGIEP